MDAKTKDEILRSVYRDAVEWQKNVKSTDDMKQAYLSAIAMVVEKYDPANVYPLYDAINKLFFKIKPQLTP